MPRPAHLLIALLACGACLAHARGESPSDSVFQMRKVHEVHLQIEPEEWDKLQPPESIDWNIEEAFEQVIADATRGGNFHSEKSSRPGLAGYMGADHQYGMASITFDGETLREVGLRYKGNGTFFSGREKDKYSFKVDFNEYHEDLKFRKLRKINLNSNSNDPSMLREALSYALFREAGVPAPRTGWAKVYLTILGQTERKYLGLYLIVEQVDKRFLKRNFDSSKGLLLKPSTFGAFRYFGDDWKEYEAAYFPKTTATPEQQQRLIEFAKLVQQADDETFERKVGDYLDLEEFTSFLAMNVILSNLDSFLGGSQNYYAYLDPESNKFQILPWDLDISFGAFTMIGTPESRRNLSINRPQIGQGSNRLIERTLAIPSFRAAYHERLDALLQTTFSEEKVFREIDALGDFLRPHVVEEGAEAAKQFEAELLETSSRAAPDALKSFVRGRRKSIEDQLAGRSDGVHLSWESDWIEKQFARWLPFALLMMGALALNAIAWVWAVIAGFRDSGQWGLLNLFLYPISPLFYGFGKRRDLGRRAATMVACSVVVFAVALGLIIRAL